MSEFLNDQLELKSTHFVQHILLRIIYLITIVCVIYWGSDC